MALQNYVDQLGPAVSAAVLNELDQIRNVVTVPVSLASLTVSVSSTFSSAVTLTLDGDGALTAPLVLSSARPQVNFVETDAAANEGRWAISAQSGQLIYSVVTDAGAGTSYMTVDRTGGTPDAITFPIKLIPTAAGGGLSSAIQITNTGAASIAWNETDGAADNKVWDLLVSSEQMLGRIINDAGSVATNWLSVDRTGTTSDTINLTATTVTHTGSSSLQSGASATVATLNSTNASGPAAVFQRSGTSFGDVGNASIIFGGTLDAMCVNARSTNHIEFATNGTLRQRIGGTGTIFFPSIGTTASAANAFLDSGSSPANQLLRSTSSIRYKSDVRDLGSSELSKLFNLRPITYSSKCEADDPTLSWYGLIAEEVAEVFPRLVHYSKDEEGRKIPDAVQYERLVILLLGKLKEHQQEIDSLRTGLAELNNRMINAKIG